MNLAARLGLGGVALCLAGGASAAPFLGPLETSGYIGYAHRSVSESNDEGSSQQVTGGLNASTYLGEPWMATTSLNLGLTKDSSEYEFSEGGSATSDNSIITGDWLLNVLPSSKTPFNLEYQMTDTRVSMDGIGATPLTYLGQDYSTTHLGLRQAYLLDNGGRYQISLDDRTWESGVSADYSSQVLGLEADLRRPRQHVLARYRDESTEHESNFNNNENQIIDLSHFYYPVRGLRTDTKASYYNYDRSFVDPASSDVRLTNTEISQVSSNAFWRPEDNPMTVSGGVRLMQMTGVSGEVEGFEQDQMAVNGGLFYQLNKRLRLDASIASTFMDIEGVQFDSHRQKAGVLYESDWHQLWGFDYNWYTGGAGRHQIDSRREITGLDFDIGHGATRTYYPGERTSTTTFTLNLGQNLQVIGESGEQSDNALVEESMLSQEASIGHTAGFAYNQRHWQGDTSAQISASTVFGTQRREQGGVEFDGDYISTVYTGQINRNQEVASQVRLVGNLSTQYSKVEDDLNQTNLSETTAAVQDGQVTDSALVTWKGLLRAEWDPRWGFSRVRLSSEYLISKTSLEGAVDRVDWINRASYGIGMLDASVTIRLTEADSENYDLVYFRVMRRF